MREKSYHCSASIIRWMRGGALVSEFLKIGLKGFTTPYSCTYMNSRNLQLNKILKASYSKEQ